jgi:hypothetical protein
VPAKIIFMGMNCIASHGKNNRSARTFALVRYDGIAYPKDGSPAKLRAEMTVLNNETHWIPACAAMATMRMPGP